MKQFMDEDFLLKTDTAKKLYHGAAESMPIIDFHNHLNAREIYEDKCFDNISDLWLSGDHYKWRAMRLHGISEAIITGDVDPYERFLAYADTIQNAIGNPLYHWTHLELRRYFGINKTLSKDTARKIYDKCNKKLKTKDYSVRNLLRMQNVKVLCTTDDPIDSLEWHLKIRDDASCDIQVLPSFRPEKAIGIEKQGFASYIKTLSDVSDVIIKNVSDVIKALITRLDFFVSEAGCKVSDHSLENTFYIPASEYEVNEIFKKAMRGALITEEDAGKYHGYLLSNLGKEYYKRDMVMQLHIGATRNNATRIYKMLGPDAGVDGMNDFNYAPELSALLDSMDKDNRLPKTILYCLNPNDLEMLAVTAGCFASNDDDVRGRVQLGSGWWFVDHKSGIKHQLRALSDVGLLGTFIGMLTDSRSFLSFPRHEYFRRILCDFVGDIVENGEYPCDMDYLSDMIRDISANNAIDYFGFEIENYKGISEVY